MLKKLSLVSLFIAAFAGSANASITPVTPSKDDTDGCYAIGTKEELYWFSDYVNYGEMNSNISCAKLIANIVVNEHVLNEDGSLNGDGSNFEVWRPIGDTLERRKPFMGSFDGQGYSISGLYYADGRFGNLVGNEKAVGLFGFVIPVAGDIVIENVRVIDSYFQNCSDVGGLVGKVSYVGGHNFKIRNAGFEGTIASRYRTGGLIGLYDAPNTVLSIENSYSRGLLSAKGYTDYVYFAGGLIGVLDDHGQRNVKVSIINSYSAMSFDFGGLDVHLSGHVIGAALNSGLLTLKNVFHLDLDVPFGDENNYGIGKSAEEFANGSVANLLHEYNDSDVDGSIWGQDVASGESYPKFIIDEKSVTYKLSDGTEFGGSYVVGTTKTLPNKIDGKEIVAWVKSGRYGYGYENASSIENWDSGDLEFYGLIHSIQKVDGCYEITNGSELYEFAYIVSLEMGACGKLTEDIVVNEKVLNSDGTLNTENVKLRQWTPIGTVEKPFKGTFDGQGHSISGLYFKMETVERYGSNRIGLFGYVESRDNETVSIKNLVVKDSYIWGYEYVGGIIGEARDVHLEVEACGFEGFVNAQNSTAAGIIGFADETRIGSSSIVVQNSYNQGAIKSYDRIGGIIGATYVETLVLSTYNVGVIEGQSKTGEIIGFAKDGAVSMAWNNYFIGTEDDAFGSAKTAEEFADGSVVTILRGSENLVWGQNVADGEKYPNFSGKIKKTKMQTDDDGCYLVASSDDLYEFAKVVDVDGEVFACGKLTADIVVNENVLDAEGNLENNDISTYKLWNPIGSVKYFSGTFDGQGHTIAGLITDENSMYGGLFGYVNGDEKEVSIRNVGVVDSYIQGAATGGIIGISQAKQIVVENIFVVASVKAVVGPEFSGMIPADQTIAGGIVAVADGLNLSNCYFVGKISSTGLVDEILAMPMGAVLVSKAYFVGIENSEYGTAMSLDDFANGSVAALLRGSDENSIWGQNVAAGDKYPNFSGSIVKPELVLTWDEASEEVNVADLEIPAEAASIAIEEGKQFFANGKIYEGELTAEDIQELKTASATLKPISGVALETAGDDTQAELSGSTETDKLIVPVEIRVAHIDIEREFKGTNSTLMVPFNVDNVDTNVLKLIEVDTVYKDMELNAWVAEGTRVESIKAHTPYIINYTGKLSFDDVELVPNVSADTKVSFGNWTFVGAYEGKTWLADDPELGKAYGFSGVAKEGIAQGQFVRIGVNAKIAPMRAYLLYNSPAVMPKPGVGVMKSAAVNVEEALPSSIILRVVDRKKNVVEEIVIEDVVQGLAGEKLNSTEEVKSRWYDLKGRRMNGKPTAHGAFIKNNKAVLNK